MPLFSFDDEILDPSLLQPSPILVGMATCHSLTVIDNCIAGDPLDVIMFNSLNWDTAKGMSILWSTRWVHNKVVIEETGE